ncbi:cupin domain-containing protein [Chitinophaga horti]|uniref:Cupin domain-containing protein n=1 Tax=Chitinophaga horti TaxID=2920382 RepID=A0ABY6IYB2_9BACT|nr:cupin domain-containing protein [Chitinophaga horti]UYQ92370.1 cupin domain-containing protein [Chitinophaga horti]
MVKNVLNAEHYIWGGLCDGWHLLQHDDLSVIQERMPPGTTEQLHLHEKSRQVFYILSGSAQMEMEGTPFTLRTGDSISVAPGQAHKISNNGAEDVHFLVISSPKSHGDRINL